MFCIYIAPPRQVKKVLVSENRTKTGRETPEKKFNKEPQNAQANKLTCQATAPNITGVAVCVLARNSYIHPPSAAPTASEGHNILSPFFAVCRRSAIASGVRLDSVFAFSGTAALVAYLGSARGYTAKKARFRVSVKGGLCSGDRQSTSISYWTLEGIDQA